MNQNRARVQRWRWMRKAMTLVLALLAGAACSGSHDETYVNEGVSYRRSAEGLLATGTAVEVWVLGYYYNVSTCTYEERLFDSPPPYCKDDNIDEPVELVSATCATPGCAVQVLASNEFSVVCDRAGTAEVDFTVLRVSTAEKLNKKVTIDYSDVTRFDVFHDRRRSLGSTLPVIRGTLLEWCASVFGTLDGTETPLYVPPTYERDPTSLTVDGTTLVVDSTTTHNTSFDKLDGALGCVNFKAAQVGNGWFAVQYGKQRQVIELQVIDPTAVVGGNLYEVLPTGTSAQTYVGSVNTASYQSCQRPALAISNRCTLGATSYGVEFQLSDGSRAGGYWGCTSSLSEGFWFRRGASNEQNSFDYRYGVFSIQGLHACSGQLQIAPGREDKTIVVNSFDVPITITDEGEHCSACDFS